MTYNSKELLELLQNLCSHPENEVVEVKEAKNGFSFNDIGEYFSALGNEANLHGKQEAWLIFGVADDMSVVGSNFRNDEKSLNSLKKEIKDRTNQALTFIEILHCL